MASRIDLHEELCDILGSRNVYFQPPESVKLKYPCIIYERDNMEIIHADDTSYHLFKRYNVTVIDKDPDSEIPDKVALLPHCRFDRHYKGDNLNHDSFSIYW